MYTWDRTCARALSACVTSVSVCIKVCANWWAFIIFSRSSWIFTHFWLYYSSCPLWKCLACFLRFCWCVCARAVWARARAGQIYREISEWNFAVASSSEPLSSRAEDPGGEEQHTAVWASHYNLMIILTQTNIRLMHLMFFFLLSLMICIIVFTKNTFLRYLYS